MSTSTATPERLFNILCVEDDPINQLVIKETFGFLGHHVTVANDGQQAIDLCGEHQFDLILMDIHMAGMDGFEATQAIRAREKEKGGRTPIYAVTGLAEPGFEAECLAKGMDGFVSKPYRIDTLRGILDKI